MLELSEFSEVPTICYNLVHATGGVIQLSTNDPLILLTNDDGIASPGLHAAARALRDLGELLIVAPRQQFSGAGRSFFYTGDGRIQQDRILVSGSELPAYAVDAAPAPTVRRAILLLASRRPDLVVAGINYGENVGVGVTISGTVGAAMEGASFGIPALAVSLQTDKEDHFNHSEEVDFSVAAHFTRLFAQRVLEKGLPPGVDVLKIDVPQHATPDTPWRLTRVSRQRYFESIIGHDDQHGPNIVDYDILVDRAVLEPDSDIWALAIDGVVSVSPLTIDLTAPVAKEELLRVLGMEGKETD
jgi:5'-nucleotidase